MWRGVIFMDFMSYLQDRHLIVPGAKEMKELSASQYNSRLNRMIEQNIYCEGNQLETQTLEKINKKYANRANEYERTIKYYLEFKKYIG